MGITQELFSALNTCFGPVRSRLPTDREREEEEGELEIYQKREKVKSDRERRQEKIQDEIRQ